MTPIMYKLWTSGYNILSTQIVNRQKLNWNRENIEVCRVNLAEKLSFYVQRLLALGSPISHGVHIFPWIPAVCKTGKMGRNRSVRDEINSSDIKII